MSKNKFKHIVTPKKILMEYHGFDEASVAVLTRELERVNIILSCEDNVLYTINKNDQTKVALTQHDYALSKINELQNFIVSQDNQNLVIRYLYEKIKSLEGKVNDLEHENRKLSEDLWSLENKNGTYHD